MVSNLFCPNFLSGYLYLSKCMVVSRVDENIFWTLAMLYKQGVSSPFLKRFSHPQACLFDWNKSQLRESLLETRPTFTRRSPWPSSVYPRFCYRKVPKPPRTLLKAIHQLKKHDGIVITNPCKGSGVVVMDKEEYLRLLAKSCHWISIGWSWKTNK